MSSTCYDCLCGQTNSISIDNCHVRENLSCFQCPECFYPFGNCASEILQQSDSSKIPLMCPSCKITLYNDFGNPLLFTESLISFSCIRCESFVPLHLLPTTAAPAVLTSKCNHYYRKYLPFNGLPIWKCDECGYMTGCWLKQFELSFCFCNYENCLENSLSLVHEPTTVESEIILHCQECKIKCQIPKLEIFFSKLSTNFYGKVKKIKSIDQISHLKCGDQIIFKRLTYDHHAIVSHIDYLHEVFCIIHYTSDLLDSDVLSILSSSTDPPTIVESQTIAFHQVKDFLFKIHYLPLDCSPSHTVIQRALSRLSESSYSLFYNNCEHFAVYCKTGLEESRQVQSLVHGLLAAPFIETPDLISLLPQQLAVGAYISMIFYDYLDASNSLENGSSRIIQFRRQVLRTVLVNMLRVSAVVLPFPVALLSNIGASSIDNFLTD